MILNLSHHPAIKPDQSGLMHYQQNDRSFYILEILHLPALKARVRK
jgi:hypothetical protein